MLLTIDRMVDLTMLNLHNSKERSLNDFIELANRQIPGSNIRGCNSQREVSSPSLNSRSMNREASLGSGSPEAFKLAIGQSRI